MTDRSRFELLATSVLRKADPDYAAIVQTGLNAAGETIVSPLDGILLEGISLTVRAASQVIFLNTGSFIINKNTESKYRATTISTYNMLRNIPYAVSAYFIGSLADTYSAKIIASYLGVVLLLLLIFPILRRPYESSNK